MGAPITLSIILPCRDDAASIGACLDQFATWRPAPELICVVPETEPALASQLAAHPAQPYVVTAPDGQPSLLGKGVAEAQGTVVLLLDPAIRLGTDAHQAIFRTLARADQGGGFFRLAFRSETGAKPLADPVAVTFASLMQAPLQSGALFCRSLTLRAAGGLPTGEPLLEYRLARRLHRDVKVVPLSELAESHQDPGDAWQTIWQVIRWHCGTPLAKLELPLPAEVAPRAMPVASPLARAIVEAESSAALLTDIEVVAAPADEKFTATIETVVDSPEARPGIDTRPLPASTAPSDGPATPAIVEELPAPTPIITADKEGFAALFADDQPEAIDEGSQHTVWGKVNAALHRMLFHDAAGPATPIPGSLPSISLPKSLDVAASVGGAPATGEPSYPEALATSSSAEEISLDWTPGPPADLHGDPRVPWSRAPLDPADAEAFTAAELSQVRRAFTDLRHPPHLESGQRSAGRVIEIAITPPELHERIDPPELH